MRYKSAEGILLEIAEDKQAPTRVRLAAAKILTRQVVLGEALPELKGYKSGSRENLLLRFATDPSIPAKDRFKAIKQLLILTRQKQSIERIANAGPGPTVTGDFEVNLEASGTG